MVKLRTLVQTLVALGTNAYLLFPFGGSIIYQGPLKAVCHPGLNCYSCPGALLSCPVGAIQNFLASIRFYTPGTIPHIGAIVVAYLGFIGTLVGRLPCGWLCPFGFIQDLIHKIPCRKFSVWEPLRWGKYAVLLILVIILPLWLVDAATGLGHPWFCKLLCPAGTLEGAGRSTCLIAMASSISWRSTSPFIISTTRRRRSTKSSACSRPAAACA